MMVMSVLQQNVSTVLITFSDPLFAPQPSGSLIDGNYTLSLFASEIVGVGGNLDGDGNHVGGDDKFTLFHRLFGDADGDRDVDISDFVAFRTAFGAGISAIFDYDGDGDVDIADFVAFRQRFGSMP